MPKGASVAWGHTLNIFGQKNNTGTLVATGTDYGAGIGSPKKINAGDVNIHGGTIDATGSNDDLHDRKGQVDGASWFTLDGRRLSGKPTTKGIYLSGGRKVVVK